MEEEKTVDPEIAAMQQIANFYVRAHRRRVSDHRSGAVLAPFTPAEMAPSQTGANNLPARRRAAALVVRPN